jgi:hypothetical protein
MRSRRPWIKSSAAGGGGIERRKTSAFPRSPSWKKARDGFFDSQLEHIGVSWSTGLSFSLGRNVCGKHPVADEADAVPDGCDRVRTRMKSQPQSDEKLRHCVAGR